MAKCIELLSLTYTWIVLEKYLQNLELFFKNHRISVQAVRWISMLYTERSCVKYNASKLQKKQNSITD